MKPPAQGRGSSQGGRFYFKIPFKLLATSNLPNQNVSTMKLKMEGSRHMKVTPRLLGWAIAMRNEMKMRDCAERIGTSPSNLRTRILDYENKRGRYAIPEEAEKVREAILKAQK